MEKKDKEKRGVREKISVRPAIKSAVLVLVAAMLLCAVLAGLLWRRRHGADEGVAIRPEREHPVGIVQTFCQKDERWAEDKLGGSVYRMGSSGCLTSCIASALSTQAATATGDRGETVSDRGESASDRGEGAGDKSEALADRDEDMTAGELNRIFSEGQVYNEQGDVVWGRIEEVMPEVRVLVAGSVDGKQIETLLDEGKYPVVKVKVGGNGAAHWVLIVGSDGGEYLCMDPLVEDGKLVPLSRHGGVVYRMRCVYWADGACATRIDKILGCMERLREIRRKGVQICEIAIGETGQKRLALRSFYFIGSAKGDKGRS